MKVKITKPELFVDDHHGIYMGQLVWKYLDERYKKQARRKLSKETIESLENGPEDEGYYDSCDSFTNVEFKTETGQKFNIQYAEGGMWVIPFFFMRTKEAEKFFGQ